MDVRSARSNDGVAASMIDREPFVNEERFFQIFREAVRALEVREVPFVLIGGLASAAMGRPRWTRDIDLFVEPTNAPKALDALSQAGFETEETFPEWLFKATREDVVVDVIFRSAGGIVLDEEMLSRATKREIKGIEITVIAPEDLALIKAVVHEEHVPRHWHDALGIIAGADLDWDYLLRRARHSARRMLALLIYAESNDLVVPARVIRELYQLIYEE